MSGDPFQKVKPGDPLKLPAEAYNSFIDAAQDLRNRQRRQASAAVPPDTHPGIVLVRNDTGRNLDQYGVVGLSDIVIAPASNEREFRAHVVFSGVVPAEKKHRGRFAVLAEPAAAGKLALAYVDAVCQVQVNAPDGGADCPCAEMLDSETGHLTLAGHGSARVLWREDGSGVKWAVVRLGKSPALFPVKLDQTGGSPGDANGPATHTYDVKDFFTGVTLKFGVDPTAAPNRFRRPGAGMMNAADFGYAQFDADGNLVLGWINEVAEQEVCGAN